jgi:hypothetical protein
MKKKWLRFKLALWENLHSWWNDALM